MELERKKLHIYTVVQYVGNPKPEKWNLVNN